MNPVNKTPRILGIAFLLQFAVSIAAMITGLIIEQKLIIPGNIKESLINIANNTWILRLNILGEMLTSITILFLGVILYITLKKQNEKIALVALVFYTLGASILAFSRFATFSLLRISQEYIRTGYPLYLQKLGSLAFEISEFGIKLLMLPFCLGATLYYYLIYKSRIVPTILSLYGLIIISLLVLVTPFTIFGYEVPILLMLFYAPYEPTIGVWVLMKGIKVKSGVTIE